MHTCTLPYSQYRIGLYWPSLVLYIVLTFWAATVSRLVLPFRRSTNTTDAFPHHRSAVPKNSALVLDTSSSMASDDWPPSRIEAGKSAAKAYCRRRAELAPNARVAIVAYNSSAEIVCGLTAVSHVATLDAAIDDLCASGCTNMKAGLELAHQLLAGTKGDCEIVLLSDGHNTEQDPRPIAESIRQYATVNTIGIGSCSEVDEPLLRTLASEYPDGRKHFRWIGDKGGLIDHFRNLGGGLKKA